MSRIVLLTTLLSLFLRSACFAEEEAKFSLSDVAGKARLFPMLGTHQRKLAVKSRDAQTYFDQGLTWMYAFNHDEAIRSFAGDAELDKDCAIAWWGISLCYGPQSNHPMNAARAVKAWTTLQEADEYFAQAERRLIEAVEIEDTLGYGEPPQWLQPARHTRGGVYLLQGNLADAERVYRQDLAKWKENVWSIEGLRQRLVQQSKHEAAAAIAAPLAKATQHADFKPTESCAGAWRNPR